MDEGHSDLFADPGQAVAGILDQVRAEAELMALVAPLHRAAAQMVTLLEQDDALALIGQQ